ncbi:Flp pilus assembly complex ATPase component TadA [Ligilactobacillus sp. WILCCON 0076]|uniref:Flp pilus assembly complex ATPase component TadA n=1 Tax=Ligilactobacillus ubinensis TaxID=2876789 RepID=A0A9X2JKS5_9LACO|nr:competence type IV pilus ATPase ComGA [Ligilactobacillus ubinensis]MCP0886274.1 Flp pilus assembly complex ATPase component TadA [Ligilactobacillus ubinensis]
MNSQLREIFKKAVEKRASDIYFLPKKDSYTISYATQGFHLKQMSFQFEIVRQWLNYLKFKANMALSEHRRPQLGSWIYEAGKEKIFCRLSTVGDFLDNESLVVRLIYGQKEEKAGYFFSDQWTKIMQACNKRGLVLFAGPMGSGKTTSMYQFARQMKNKQVLCIEDPIEIHEPNFLQLQVNEKAEMTYSELLKVALRHHPDAFIIGEIRDEKTAQAVIKAALSGHLIFSTVHAQDAGGVITRLQNLGVSKDEILQAVQMVSYQRLLPTIDGNSKVLFDQIDNLEIRKGNYCLLRMTEEWSERLEICVKNKWISNETKKQFSKG